MKQDRRLINAYLKKLNKINIQNEILIPKHKDWNENLTLLEKGKGDICQAL